MGAQDGIDIPALKAQLLKSLGPDAKIYPVHIETQFPRILARIVTLWGKPDLDTFLVGLMLCDRPGRQGFPVDVATELFRLASLHGTLGLTPQAPGLGWAGADDSELYERGVLKPVE